MLDVRGRQEKVMKMKRLFILCLLSLSASSFATTLKEGQVARVTPNTSGNIVIKMEDVEFSEEECDDSQFVVIDGSNSEHANRLMSVALAAQAQDKKLRVYVSGCMIAFPWQTSSTAPIVRSLGIE